METESETDWLFYLKATQKRQNPSECHFEIIFAFDSSATMIDDEPSIAISKPNHVANILSISTPAESAENVDNKDMHSKEKTHPLTTETFKNIQAVTRTNSKRSLFGSDDIAETKSKSQNKAHKDSQSSDKLLSSC